MTPPTDLSSPPTSGGAQGRAQSAAEEASSQASQVAGAAKESAAKVADSAGQELHAMKAEAADAAKTLVGDARQQLRGQASEQANRLASTLGDLSGQFRSMADSGSPGVAQDLVREISQRADALRSRLDERGIDGALDDAKRFARNRPGLFLVGAAAAGLVVGRVLRTTDTHALMEAAKPTNGTDQSALGASSYGELPAESVLAGSGATGGFSSGSSTTAPMPSTAPLPSTPTMPASTTAPSSDRPDRPLRATGDPTP
jgi:uncharacterized protein YjbJ (UPF0337 family)